MKYKSTIHGNDNDDGAGSHEPSDGVSHYLVGDAMGKAMGKLLAASGKEN
ncbi:MAG: hypothetical protein ACI9E1_000981 [Cryomorphaceae bacterium]|jgi:hypothetical protein